MKLKLALKITKTKGFKWVAVDADKTIFMYMKKPKRHTLSVEWDELTSTSLMFYCERYSGSKSWVDTLRRVK